MARKVILVHIDDLDGTPADRKVSFGIDGVDYEIDLSTANAARLTKILAAYIAKGRRQVRKGRSTSTGSRTMQGADNASSIRQWAERNGYSPRSRGPLSAEILEAHERTTTQVQGVG